MSADPIDILYAFSVWEQAVLVHADITGANKLKAYPIYPPPDDIDTRVNGPLQLPFTCHSIGRSQWMPVSVRQAGGSLEDQQTHEIFCMVIFGLQKDRPDLLALRDAQWRIAYRAAVLKNLQGGLTIGPGDGPHSISIQMGDTNPIGFDLENMQVVGIMTPVTATVRQSMATI